MAGEYFSWLSHDDVYYPQKIEMQMKYLQENQLTDAILYGGYELIDESSNNVGQIRPERMYSEEKLSIPLFPIIIPNYPIDGTRYRY